jgi:hypothetical protein
VLQKNLGNHWPVRLLTNVTKTHLLENAKENLENLRQKRVKAAQKAMTEAAKKLTEMQKLCSLKHPMFTDRPFWGCATNQMHFKIGEWPLNHVQFAPDLQNFYNFSNANAHRKYSLHTNTISNNSHHKNKRNLKLLCATYDGMIYIYKIYLSRETSTRSIRNITVWPANYHKTLTN